LLRRALAVAFAAASLALVPATASATPEQAPVDNYMSTQYFGTATVHLSDGRTANVSLMEDRSTGGETRASLSVRTYREVPCTWGPGTCQTDFGGAFVPLTDEQVDVDRSLGGASVADVPVTIVTYVVGSNGYTPVEETVTISVVLTGTGPVSRDAYRSNECPMGGECQSIRVEASRAAVAEVTFGGDTVSGEGSLFRGHSINAAAPKVVYDGS
jgi:hypothetical protein